MAGLPKLDMVQYKHFLVGLNKTVKFRSFTVKEQKILLHAKEESTVEAYVDAIKQIVELCTFGELNVDTLPFFDLEDLFVQMRIKSVSDMATINYTMYDERTDVEGKKQKISVEVAIDLKEAKVSAKEGHSNTIKLTPTITAQMRYPTLTEMVQSVDQQNLVISCIESIFDGENFIDPKNFSKEEMNEWVDGFGLEQIAALKGFFDTLPRLKLEKEIELNGEKKVLKFEGLQSFFGYA